MKITLKHNNTFDFKIYLHFADTLLENSTEIFRKTRSNGFSNNRSLVSIMHVDWRLWEFSGRLPEFCPSFQTVFSEFWQEFASPASTPMLSKWLLKLSGNITGKSAQKTTQSLLLVRFHSQTVIYFSSLLFQCWEKYCWCSTATGSIIKGSLRERARRIINCSEFDFIIFTCNFKPTTKFPSHL